MIFFRSSGWMATDMTWKWFSIELKPTSIVSEENQDPTLSESVQMCTLLGTPEERWWKRGRNERVQIKKVECHSELLNLPVSSYNSETLLLYATAYCLRGWCWCFCCYCCCCCCLLLWFLLPLLPLQLAKWWRGVDGVRRCSRLDVARVELYFLAIDSALHWSNIDLTTRPPSSDRNTKSINNREVIRPPHLHSTCFQMTLKRYLLVYQNMCIFHKLIRVKFFFGLIGHFAQW